jgi:hypothetical protein
VNYRRSEKKDKKLADDARLLRAWKKFHREECEVALAGPHGCVLSELFRMIKNLQHVQPAQLIGLAHSIDWSAIDFDTRLVVLHELNAAITRFREKRNPDEPIDDTVSGEPPFRVIKAILFPERAPTGAQPGLSISKPAA